MTLAIDLTGKTFGRLTVIRRDGSDKDGKAVWHCVCTCGTEKGVRGKHLRSGAVTSCGCFSSESLGERRRMDIAGEKYGRLTAVGPTNLRANGCVLWDFTCDCGGTLQAQASSVKSGNTKSCGCLQPEIMQVQSTVHGMMETLSYQVWANMKSRCTNPNNTSYASYGGRGISVCPEWLESFEAFFADMGERPIGKTLGRSDNDGGYEPTNCAWETNDEQGVNKRNTVFVVYQGERESLKTLTELLGLPYARILERKSKKKITHQEAFDYYIGRI